jgi:alkyl sulfatase BDS1-like metallo-beta-lactamase superfamily hydrolase
MEVSEKAVSEVLEDKRDASMLIHDYSLSINNQSAVSPKVEQTPILTYSL